MPFNVQILIFKIIPQVYSELLRDLKKFVRSRVGETVQLKIPTLYHSYEDGSTDSHVLVIEDLAKYENCFPQMRTLWTISNIQILPSKGRIFIC